MTASFKAQRCFFSLFFFQSTPQQHSKQSNCFISEMISSLSICDAVSWISFYLVESLFYSLYLVPPTLSDSNVMFPKSPSSSTLAYLGLHANILSLLSLCIKQRWYPGNCKILICLHLLSLLYIFQITFLKIKRNVINPVTKIARWFSIASRIRKIKHHLLFYTLHFSESIIHIFIFFQV